MEKTVIELFAGVGGFRVGLNEVTLTGDKVEEKPNFKFVWANQWEPETKSQDAFNCYVKRFGSSGTSNIDISLVDKKKEVPNHNLLTGGFPCQDYSVARSLSNEKGIEGKKGVLWWQINDILKAKKPSFVLLENVDRLVKAPSKQRGRDFGTILRCFCDLNYSVQYRIINAADYGHSQRRRRTYIFAYLNKTKYGKEMIKKSAKEIMEKDGIFAKGFPVEQNNPAISTTDISSKKFADLLDLQKVFAFDFGNSGYISKGIVNTEEANPITIESIKINQIMLTCQVDNSLFLSKSSLEKFKKLKGAKKLLRTAKNGHQYWYSEGPIAWPDYLDRPGRTMLTSEGTINRSTHVIEDFVTKKYRILDPVECERLQEFPDNWTNTGMTRKKRYFMMGNALVCGIVKTIGFEISKIMDKE